MVKFGPTLASEVIAAGLGETPLSWSSDGTISGRDRLTKQQNATLDAVIAAHDPSKALPPPKTLNERLLDALVAEGIVPPGKLAAIAARMKL